MPFLRESMIFKNSYIFWSRHQILSLRKFGNNTNFNRIFQLFFSDNEENEPKIKTLRTENTPQKKMVQEIKSGRKSPQSEFAKNLKNNYLKNNAADETSGGKNENIQELKIYENLASQMAPVSTKQFTPKTPLFGRAHSTEKNEVRLKFLLNGVDEMKSIFFYFPEMVNISYLDAYNLFYL